MGSKKTLAAKLQQEWTARLAGERPKSSCFIGFDGFTDQIIHAVRERDSATEYAPFALIQDFGQRIVDAAGRSCNIELVTQRTKAGGNAPLLAYGMLPAAHEMTFCGTIGNPDEVEPLFQKLADGCHRVITLGPSAHSDAVEFDDGKIILGKLESLANVDYENLLKRVQKQELIALLDASDLFVSANWTMLPMMNDLWGRIHQEITPHFKQSKLRHLYVDLADPAKRPNKDILEALKQLKALTDTYSVHLGLNEAEAERIFETSCQNAGPIPTSTEDIAVAIYENSSLSTIILHATDHAVAVTEAGVALVPGPYTRHPKLTTGAGDHFNAGFCNALLYGLPTEECLLTGVATSGFYVRQGISPTMNELAAFLERWEITPDPEQL